MTPYCHDLSIIFLRNNVGFYECEAMTTYLMPITFTTDNINFKMYVAQSCGLLSLAFKSSQGDEITSGAEDDIILEALTALKDQFSLESNIFSKNLSLSHSYPYWLLSFECNDDDISPDKDPAWNHCMLTIIHLALNNALHNKKGFASLEDHIEKNINLATDIKKYLLYQYGMPKHSLVAHSIWALIHNNPDLEQIKQEIPAELSDLIEEAEEDYSVLKYHLALKKALQLMTVKYPSDSPSEIKEIITTLNFNLSFHNFNEDDYRKIVDAVINKFGEKSSTYPRNQMITSTKFFAEVNPNQNLNALSHQVIDILLKPLYFEKTNNFTI